MVSRTVWRRDGVDASAHCTTTRVPCFPHRFDVPAAEEGFPRSDIDIVAVRGARARYAVLQTDYSALMREAEKKLELLHSLPLDAEAAPAARRKAAPREPAPAAALAPAPEPAAADRFGVSAFAEAIGVVQGTLPDGPAYKCGLRAGMEVLRFGSATAASTRAAGGGLGALTAVTQSSAGGRVEVVVRLPAAAAAADGAAGARSAAATTTAATTAAAAAAAAAAASAAGAAVTGRPALQLLVLSVPSPPRIGLHIVPPAPPSEEDA